MPTQIRFYRTGGPDVLQFEDAPFRKLDKQEIRFNVEAIGINRAEIMFREGQCVEAPDLPASLGYEAAGVIEELGPGVEGLKKGDRVATIPAFSMNRNHRQDISISADGRSSSLYAVERTVWKNRGDCSLNLSPSNRGA